MIRFFIGLIKRCEDGVARMAKTTVPGLVLHPLAQEASANSSPVPRSRSAPRLACADSEDDIQIEIVNAKVIQRQLNNMAVGDARRIG